MISNRIKRFEAAVKRLEATSGTGQRYCEACRYRERYCPNLQKNSAVPSDDILELQCEFCQSWYTTNLARIPEGLARDFYREQCSYTLEDQYTNPKAHAMVLWICLQMSMTLKRQGNVNEKAKDYPEVRPPSELARKEVNALIARKHRRLTAKYGSAPFPEHMQIFASARGKLMEMGKTIAWVPGLWDLESERVKYLVSAELEKIIWEESLSVTISAIDEIECKINALIDAEEKDALNGKDEVRLDKLNLVKKARASADRPPSPDDHGENSGG